MTLNAGQILINRYKVIKLLGQGGQSNVYLLSDLRLKGKKWVGKEMVAQYKDPADIAHAKKHFEMEAHLLANLKHTNLPCVTDYFFEGGNYYLIMEYLQGEDLEKMIKRSSTPFDEETVVGWALQLTTVLYYLHCQKEPIIFRDIKPSNIMIHGSQVKLIDFGIARHFNPAKKGDTLRIGSPGYSPPEQYNAQTDPRSDVYSLGVTLHQLLTGFDPTQTQTPFRLPPVKALNNKISSKMASIIEKATQIDPDKRYQTMAEFKKDLKELVGPNYHTKTNTDAIKTMPVKLKSTTVPVSPPNRTLTRQDPLNAKKKLEQNKKNAAPPIKKTIAGKLTLVIKNIFIFLLLFATAYLAYSRKEIFIFYSVELFKKIIIPKASPVPGIPSPNKSFFEKGIEEYKAGRFSEAIDNFKKAIDRNENNPASMIMLENSYVRAAGADFITISVLAASTSLKQPNSFLYGVMLQQKLINYEGGIRGKKLVIDVFNAELDKKNITCLLYTSPSPRDS